MKPIIQMRIPLMVFALFGRTALANNWWLPQHCSIMHLDMVDSRGARNKFIGAVFGCSNRSIPVLVVFSQWHWWRWCSPILSSHMTWSWMKEISFRRFLGSKWRLYQQPPLKFCSERGQPILDVLNSSPLWVRLYRNSAYIRLTRSIIAHLNFLHLSKPKSGRWV